MSTKLQEDIKRWLQSKPEYQKNFFKNKKQMIFLELQEDIKKMLAVGFNKKMIYHYLTDTEKLNCSYKSFLGYIDRYITNEFNITKSKSQTISQPKKIKNKMNKTNRTTIIVEAAELPKFQINNNPANAKELY